MTLARFSVAFVLFAAVSLLTTTGSVAQDKKDKEEKKAKTFVRDVYKDGKFEMPYWVHVPGGVAKKKGKDEKKDAGPHPVILFLHGWGERQDGDAPPTRVGIGPHVEKIEKLKDFLIVVPQADAPKGGPAGWDGDNAKGAMAILDLVMKEHNGDPKRQYLTGLSMGGSGAWHLAAAHPDRWAAVAPICGWTRANDAAKVKGLPIWCFHGAKDDAVDVKESRDMIAAIKKAQGKGDPEPEYTEFKNAGHGCWDSAYGDPKLYTWMLKHKTK